MTFLNAKFHMPERYLPGCTSPELFRSSTMSTLCYGKSVLFLLGTLLVLSNVPPIVAQTKGSIRSVDFYNFTYELDPHNKIVLRKGLSREESLPHLFSEQRLILLRYVDFNGDGREEAVIAIRDLEPASIAISMDYFVYDFYEQSARQIFHEWRDGPKGLCIRGHSLIITAASWADDRVPVPRCCPEYTERKIYQLRGSGFIVTSRRRWKNYPFQHPAIYKKLLRCS